MDNQYEKALAIFKNGLNINPVDADLLRIVGTSYNQLERYDKAIEYYTKSIEIDNTLNSAYTGRADTYRMQGDFTKALEDIYKAIELNSTEPFSFLTLAEINASLKKENEFYINLDIGLKLAVEKGENFPEIVEKAFKKEDVYKPFYQKERFKKILEKYPVQFNMAM